MRHPNKLMAEEFLENSDQHLQMTLAVTNTITHLMENKCKCTQPKVPLGQMKETRIKKLLYHFIKTSIENVWNSTIWCGLLFTVQSVLLHLFSPFTLVGSSFFGLWRGETAQYLSWKIGCAKKRKGQYHMWYEIFPLLCGHFLTQKVYTYPSLTSQKCWCLNKKSYKEEMLSSFSIFSYNLTTEILVF